MIDYFKQEWEGVNDVALAILDWVHWYNHERLHSTNGYLSPINAENNYYRSLIPSGYAAWLKQTCLRENQDGSNAYNDLSQLIFM